MKLLKHEIRTTQNVGGFLVLFSYFVGNCQCVLPLNAGV